MSVEVLALSSKTVLAISLTTLMELVRWTAVRIMMDISWGGIGWW